MARSTAFLRTVARDWRLRQDLINGHSHRRLLAQQAESALHALIADDAWRQEMADGLFHLLDAAGRTSSSH